MVYIADSVSQVNVVLGVEDVIFFPSRLPSSSNVVVLNRLL